jgi:hypothetical protein
VTESSNPIGIDVESLIRNGDESFQVPFANQSDIAAV